MARFTACLVMIALIIVLLAASTTAEIVNPGSWESQRCRQQIERQRLSSCREYLIDSSRSVRMEGGNQGGSWRRSSPGAVRRLSR
ncbi:UNVERIFIED_CONTAM: hypothetical protein Scaly_2166800 [Sesamum calycinum]|uniref:Uncharacterized protein n=1 Tax=Sesamum calycinum TaxID=2727403 RepID=A0AAW2MPF2_9LAMI